LAAGEAAAVKNGKLAFVLDAWAPKSFIIPVKNHREKGRVKWQG